MKFAFFSTLFLFSTFTYAIDHSYMLGASHPGKTESKEVASSWVQNDPFQVGASLVPDETRKPADIGKISKTSPVYDSHSGASDP